MGRKRTPLPTKFLMGNASSGIPSAKFETSRLLVKRF
jgi:hypothetical protein